MFSFISKSLDDTRLIASSVAHLTRKGDVFCLKGAMGRGKTAFCKEFIASISDKSPNDVISPTFPIIVTYATSLGDLYHLDLYRVDHEEELFELGIDEIINNNICLIEWSEKLGSYYPETPIVISINGKGEELRVFNISIPDNLKERFASLSNLKF